MFDMSSDFDAGDIMKAVMDAASEQVSLAAADRAMELGVNDADQAAAAAFDLDLNVDGIDIAVVEARAREILLERLS
ncbi:hypothetical protein JOF28_000416 [Leucobacter exalbidus]|uniref:Uncharacterized protein n=1 Tax=Leucobacter exalbidus TaxID=662960 RepID=A0A940T305_9MICO|nr:hypothetical protein [Leucobacter exalbidus]MBP1325184.1 hypothetical protein [Leucobacter exalbidus]